MFRVIYCFIIKLNILYFFIFCLIYLFVDVSFECPFCVLSFMPLLHVTSVLSWSPALGQRLVEI